MPGSSAAIAVAEVSAPHGVRGQLRFHLYDPDSRALRRGLRVELRPPNSAEGHARSDMSHFFIKQTHSGSRVRNEYGAAFHTDGQVATTLGRAFMRR